MSSFDVASLVSGIYGNMCSFVVVRDASGKEEIALIILRHFDYIKIVVDLICINDKLIFTYSELF